jgi:hypothetical protein
MTMTLTLTLNLTLTLTMTLTLTLTLAKIPSQRTEPHTLTLTITLTLTLTLHATCMHDPESHPTLTKANRELAEQVTALTEKLNLIEAECAKDPDPDHNWMKAITITIANNSNPNLDPHHI